MDYFVYEWKTKHKPFTWLRLTEASQKKLLNNNAAQFVDADIARRFDLHLTVKGNQVFDNGEPMAKILALSTFSSDTATVTPAGIAIGNLPTLDIFAPPVFLSILKLYFKTY